MNIKKIIRERLEDDWEWAKEIKPAIILEPNTMYYFEPELKPGEVEIFAYGITNSDYIQQWLLSKIPMLKTRGIKYFVTGHNLNSGLLGWCTETPPEHAKMFYSNSNLKFVDARKKFNL